MPQERAGLPECAKDRWYAFVDFEGRTVARHSTLTWKSRPRTRCGRLAKYSLTVSGLYSYWRGTLHERNHQRLYAKALATARLSPSTISVKVGCSAAEERKDTSRFRGQTNGYTVSAFYRPA